MVTELQDQGTSIDDALDTQARDGPEDWRTVHQHKQRRCSAVNDPRGIVFDRNRLRLLNGFGDRVLRLKMIERDHLAGERRMLANEREIITLKIRRGWKVRPGNDYIVESNDPRCLIHVRPRFHPKHAIDRRIGARRSNGYSRASFEVASLPFFNLWLENADFDAVVFELARPTQLHSARGEGLGRGGQLPCRVGWLALGGASHCHGY